MRHVHHPSRLGWPLPPGAKRLGEPLLNMMARQIARQHPSVLDRLSDFADTACLIIPEGMPAAILLTLRQPPSAPQLRLVRPRDVTAPQAVIRARLAILLQLLEGRLDGDALFFSRDLIVEGDMEIVVALRNAIDDAGIDMLRDLSLAFGPMAAPMERLANRALSAALDLQARLRPQRLGAEA